MSQGTIQHDRRLERLRRELAEQAEVFEDPGAYLAGVDDVFAAMQRPTGPGIVLEDEGDELPPPGGWFG